MTSGMTLRLGALFAALAVAIGAFAAHALEERLDAAALRTIEIGVRYQMYHALALVGCAALADRGRRVGIAAGLFAVGIVLFSGSLYGLALLEWRWLGPVTPLGGVSFLAGWVVLVLASRVG